MAGAAGGRARRHRRDGRRQRREPGRLPQAARRADRRGQLSHAAAAGPGRVWDPHGHRCRVRPDVGRRDRLRRGPDPQPARRDAAARRPELRLRAPGPEDRRGGSGLPGPRQDRVRRPGLPVLQRLPDGSWLSFLGGVTVRVIDRLDRHHQRRQLRQRVPATNTCASHQGVAGIPADIRPRSVGGGS
jgi:hypothetical protein